MMTSNNSQPLCLETSFTSLQSPGVGEPYPLISCSSKGSSMAGSLFGRSQLNSILHYDGTGSAHDEHLVVRSTSAGPSDTTTVILSDQSYRTKSVAFDIKSSGPSTSSPSPNIFLKSILHRQTSELKWKFSIDQQTRKSMAPPHPPPPPRKLEFVTDEWIGIAPLASPETLSEISSISSRTSLGFNLASSIENYLHRIGTSNGNHFVNDININVHDLFESQLHTPKVMRRAPKITGNLSTCADDWQSIDKYKRMGKVFITNPVPLLSSNSSGSGSFESTQSITKSKCYTTNTNDNSKSADNLDNDLHHASICTNKLTMSDSAILDGCNAKCPRCPCKRSTISLRVPCCRRNDHSWCMEMPDDPLNQTSSSDTYHSAFSSLATIENYPPQNIIRPLPSGVLESHFPVYSESNINESTSLLPFSVRSPKNIKKMNKPVNNGKNDAGFKRYANDYEHERRVSRNDSLPLLANLVEKSSPNSFNRRRNHTVYPITTSPRYSPSKRAESNV